jgi:2-polyprenyl-3-methyl-5-hydroxy-6-metoxy-1,4-benzoquinol methylase
VILDLLNKHDTKGTFFVLGWVAEHFPDLVREIERQGHEKRVRQLDILEIGGGQQMERARYEGINNQVTAIDLDVIPCGFDLGSYLRMFQENGFGRFAKTVGRKLLLVNRGKQLAWEKALGIINLPTPTFIQGDICHAIPKSEAYDLVVSWSTFEHLSEPKIALQNADSIAATRGSIVHRHSFIHLK